MEKKLKNLLFILILLIISVSFYLLFNKHFDFLPSVILSFFVLLISLIIIGFFLYYFNKEKTKEYLDDSKNLYNIITESILISLILGIIITVLLNNYITPRTEITVSCKPNEHDHENYDFIFKNNAVFSGDDFKIYIYHDDLDVGMISYKPPIAGDLCKEATKVALSLLTADDIIGLSIGCDYIPPESEISFTVIPNKDIEPHFEIKYWSKTTKFTTENIICS